MFYLSIALIIISLLFIGSALILDLLSRVIPIRSKPRTAGESLEFSSLPFISIILPSFCEEKLIQKKLDNVYDTTYPLEKYEVIVGLDESPDRTAELVGEYREKNKRENLRLEIFPNLGKSQAVNRCVELARGDIIISIDVDTIHRPETFMNIVERFVGDEKLGGLSCVPDVGDDGSERSYWKHEIRVRALESRFGLMPIVTGWLFGVRKKAYVPIPESVMSDDFWIPMAMGSKGWKICQDERVIVKSHLGSDEREYQRRRRVCRGGMECIRELRRRRMLKPLSRRLILFLHKQSRWFLGMWLGVFTIAVAMLLTTFSTLLGVASFVLMLLFVIWMWTGKSRKYVIGSLLLPVVSYIDSIRMPVRGTWERVRS